jgi:hypothetical protein
MAAVQQGALAPGPDVTNNPLTTRKELLCPKNRRLAGPQMQCGFFSRREKYPIPKSIESIMLKKCSNFSVRNYMLILVRIKIFHEDN